MSRLFDNNNPDYLDAGNPSALNLTGDEVTLSVWLRLASVNGEGKIFAKWADSGSKFQYLLSIDSDDKCLFAINASSQKSIAGTTVLAVGTWFHIAGVYDGSEMRVYCNGVEENSISQTGNMPSTTAPVRIGAGSGGAGTENPFDGNIGHCAIWGIGLSENEIISLANGINPLKIRPENIISPWPLNGQSPELDFVNGFNMTVNGTTVADEPPIPNSIKAP